MEKNYSIVRPAFQAVKGYPEDITITLLQYNRPEISFYAVLNMNGLFTDYIVAKWTIRPHKRIDV